MKIRKGKLTTELHGVSLNLGMGKLPRNPCISVVSFNNGSITENKK